MQHLLVTIKVCTHSVFMKHTTLSCRACRAGWPTKKARKGFSRAVPECQRLISAIKRHALWILNTPAGSLVKARWSPVKSVLHKAGHVRYLQSILTCRSLLRSLLCHQL